jgi:hypothetical protein
LVKQGNTLIGIDPSFECDADFVPVAPNKAAFADGEKVIKGDVEIFWKKSSPSECS